MKSCRILPEPANTCRILLINWFHLVSTVTIWIPLPTSADHWKSHKRTNHYRWDIIPTLGGVLLPDEVPQRDRDDDEVAQEDSRCCFYSVVRYMNIL